jgi:hypothetical protein
MIRPGLDRSGPGGGVGGARSPRFTEHWAGRSAVTAGAADLSGPGQVCRRTCRHHSRLEEDDGHPARRAPAKPPACARRAGRPGRRCRRSPRHRRRASPPGPPAADPDRARRRGTGSRPRLRSGPLGQLAQQRRPGVRHDPPSHPWSPPATHVCSCPSPRRCLSPDRPLRPQQPQDRLRDSQPPGPVSIGCASPAWWRRVAGTPAVRGRRSGTRWRRTRWPRG